MMSRTVALMCLGVAALVTATSAGAVVKRATYTGTLDEGYDLTGIFGVPDADLTGARYVTTYTFVPGIAGHQFIEPGRHYEWGGGYDGSTNPMLSSTLTIHGVTITLVPDWYGEAGTSLYPFVGETSESLSDDGIIARDTWFANRASPLIGSASLLTNFSTDTQENPDFLLGVYFPYGHFQFTDYDRSVGDFTTRFTVGVFSGIGTFSITDVPEPASWAMMIAGIGLVGGAARRRRAHMLG